MGLVDYFKVKWSHQDDSETDTIKMPNNILNNDRDDDSYPDDDIIQVKEMEKIEKIHDPILMMETIQIVCDEVLDYFPVHELLELQLSSKYFNELVNNSFIRTRSALWWSNYWKRMLIEKVIDNNETSTQLERFRFGYIRSCTENTSTANNFTASTLSIDEEKEQFPYLLEGSEEAIKYLEESDTSQPKQPTRYPRESNKPFIGSESSDTFKITRKKAKKLLKDGGEISDIVKMRYSSTGKSGSANGNFSKNFLVKKVNTTHFSEKQRFSGRAAIVDLAESSLKFIFWIILQRWWPLYREQSDNDGHQLIVHITTIKRKKEAYYDRRGPAYRQENIELVSIIYRVKGKPDFVIGTFSKHHSYCG